MPARPAERVSYWAFGSGPRNKLHARQPLTTIREADRTHSIARTTIFVQGAPVTITVQSAGKLKPVGAWRDFEICPKGIVPCPLKRRSLTVNVDSPELVGVDASSLAMKARRAD